MGCWEVAVEVVDKEVAVLTDGEDVFLVVACGELVDVAGVVVVHRERPVVGEVERGGW